MNYVGIDPSTLTGICVLNENGEVITVDEVKTKVKEEPQRFMDLADKVISYIGQGDSVTIEGFSYGSRGQGVSTQYGIGWAIRMKLVELQGMDYIYKYTDVAPSALKKFVTGKGNASKDIMMRDVFKKWGFENNSNNICDAYALARYGLEKGME
ncbi:crossover junction endodeoxyribonuclease RuvC [Virgibacillus sp. Bac332]|uniref:crossover junction endodeoxyribonuclease RuvC n=1 Tax=Virgibacillus sp. Bac332 TaxID=2419842 RepID=UPI000EF464F2|nr:crossover junction endodeoxyribonuclease RuvC [Virgibacillus sp. Bac332]